ncbi:MAG: type I glyceraldehyde-3-phosphate dehydrogenase, partial [Candidatus Margulisbacteria bacterium]|nr:type I glyceraldehyde-3-phosphate dehydrogenase [Candidatus Margulisiibacteriota bacterium]
AKEVNAEIKKAAEGKLKGILGYTEEPLVSVDLTGNPLSSIVDAALTMDMDGSMVKVVSWYDNEMGFSNRMNDFAKLMGKSL